VYPRSASRRNDTNHKKKTRQKSESEDPPASQASKEQQLAPRHPLTMVTVGSSLPMFLSSKKAARTVLERCYNGYSRGCGVFRASSSSSSTTTTAAAAAVPNPDLVDLSSAPSDFLDEGCAVVYDNFITPQEGRALADDALFKLKRYVRNFKT